MKLSDKKILFIKAIVKKRVDKAKECIDLLNDVVKTYVDDPIVKESAEKCIKYLREQIADVEKILEEL